MSIFKAKQWWTVSSNNTDTIYGLQNEKSLRVDRLKSQDEGDSIISGDASGILKIHRPLGEFQPSDSLLEVQLDPVLQVTSGKFTVGADIIQIAVLHPHYLRVFDLQSKDGHTEFGDQNSLVPLFKQKLKENGFSLVTGHFGRVKGREMICVQCLKGIFSFFDQEIELFSCVISGILIPSPFCYIESADLFVIIKTDWIIELYSYQQFVKSGDVDLNSQRGGKKLVCEWSYYTGEEITSVQVVQTCNDFSNILALGERHMFSLQDNGLLRYMKKFDYVPVCFCAYLIGWYYEPGARLLSMVASDDSKLYIYENTTLLWSCSLAYTPISISRCFMKGLPGGFVTLSTDGSISCCYLGTEPDLSVVPIMRGQHIDDETVQKELKDIEVQLKKLEAEEGIEETDGPAERSINVEVKMLPVKEYHSNEHIYDTKEPIPEGVLCPVLATITSQNTIQNVQVSFNCTPPLTCTNIVSYLDSVTGEEVIQTFIRVSSDAVVSDPWLTTVLSYLDESGRSKVIKVQALVPLELFCKPASPAKDARYKFTLTVEGTPAELLDLFGDFASEETIMDKAWNNNAVAFENSSDSVITIILAKTSQRYRLQSDNYDAITAIVYAFAARLSNHVRVGNTRPMNISSRTFPMDLMQAFVASIEEHASERIILQGLETELTILMRQFTLIQRRLLVQFGCLPPGPCEGLDFLLKDTQKKMAHSVNAIGSSRDSVLRRGLKVMSLGQLVLLSLKYLRVPDSTRELLTESFALSSLLDENQEWEETISQSISFILKTTFVKSEKEKDKLAPLSEHGILKEVNLKHLIKNIRIVLERVISERTKDNKDQNSNTDNLA